MVNNKVYSVSPSSELTAASDKVEICSPEAPWSTGAPGSFADSRRCDKSSRAAEFTEEASPGAGRGEARVVARRICLQQGSLQGCEYDWLKHRFSERGSAGSVVAGVGTGGIMRKVFRERAGLFPLLFPLSSGSLVHSLAQCPGLPHLAHTLRLIRCFLVHRFGLR